MKSSIIYFTLISSILLSSLLLLNSCQKEEDSVPQAAKQETANASERTDEIPIDCSTCVGNITIDVDYWFSWLIYPFKAKVQSKLCLLSPWVTVKSYEVGMWQQGINEAFPIYQNHYYRLILTNTSKTETAPFISYIRNPYPQGDDPLQELMRSMVAKTGDIPPNQSVAVEYKQVFGNELGRGNCNCSNAPACE